VVPNREEIEEIAIRLERCFDEPLSFGGRPLHCSASAGVALYPQDGATKDSLLKAADDAMYAAKNARKQIGQMLAAQQHL
jgi:GGDEF domain-containing protein